MFPRHGQVVRNHRKLLDHLIHEGPTTGPMPIIGEMDPRFQLGDNHRSDGRIVLVEDRSMEVLPAALDVDQKTGVQEETVHPRPS